jgi:hypothetical protein
LLVQPDQRSPMQPNTIEYSNPNPIPLHLTLILTLTS